MPFAIIELAGKQFKVSQGDTFTVTGQFGATGTSVRPTAVLLNQDKTLELGHPSLDNSVNLTVVEAKRGPKIEVSTFKSKSRYRKHRGYRDELTVFKVVSLKAAQ